MPGAIVAFGSISGYGANNVYIVVKPPQPVIGGSGRLANGGTIGAAGWGPTNTPVVSGSPQEALATWGGPIAGNVAPLVQEAALFLSQRPQGGHVGVRVSDGTDLAATGAITDSTAAGALLATALFTGTEGNKIKIIRTKGTKDTGGAPMSKVIVQLGQFAPEIYDNIPVGAAGAVWPLIVAAVNGGNGPTQPPSRFVRLALNNPASTHVPNGADDIITLAGGTNGAGVNTAALLGADGAAGARTGLYALKGQPVDVLWLAGCSDSTSWATLAVFAQAETALAVGAFPAYTGVDAAVAAKLAAGIDTPYMALYKDFVTYFDTILNANVAVPPSCVFAGVACRVAPHESPGNKAVYGLIGTDATLGANPQPYSDTDEAKLQNAGIGWVSLGGAPAFRDTFAIRHGKNTSSAFATSEVAYTRKTNRIVHDLSGPVMGQFVEMGQSTRSNDPTREAARSALNDYFGPQVSEGEIDAFTAICDLSNNPVPMIKRGRLKATVAVEYMSIVNQFEIDLTAGQTVSVSLSSSPLQQLA